MGRRGHRPLRPRRDLRGSGGGGAAGEGAVRPRQAALQGRLHLGGSPVQTSGTDGVHSIEFVVLRNNYYPMMKRRVKNHACFSTRVFSSLFISEDYSLAHSYTLQETEGRQQTGSFICVPLMSGPSITRSIFYKQHREIETSAVS